MKKKRSASQWFDYYERYNLPLGKYIPLVKHLKLVAAITDINGNLLSLPPLVNGQLSCISENTNNVFIDVTGTDLLRVSTVMTVVVSLFAKFCSGGIEYVNVRSPLPELSP